MLRFLFACILTFLLAFVLTRRREEEWGRREGVDLFLKSNSPTPTGGEQILNPQNLIESKFFVYNTVVFSNTFLGTDLVTAEAVFKVILICVFGAAGTVSWS